MIVIVPQSPSLPAIERSVLFSIFQMVMSYSFNDLLASFLLLTQSIVPINQRLVWHSLIHTDQFPPP